jgi:hypothetical protein
LPVLTALREKGREEQGEGCLACYAKEFAFYSVGDEEPRKYFFMRGWEGEKKDKLH